MMFDFIQEFFVKYYLSEGYNIVNTVTYGLVLGYLAFKVLIPRLKPLLGGVDRRLILMLAPYILYGATLRELVDQDLGLYAGHTVFPANYLLVSPGIYFTMFALTLGCILVAKVVEKLARTDYHYMAGGLGWVLCCYNLYLIATNLHNPINLANVLKYFLLSSLVVLFLKAAFKLKYLDHEGNVYIVLAHMFDASTTFVGVDMLGLMEKHVVPTFFINIFHTAAVMYPLKLIVLLPALWVIDDEMKDDEFGRRFIKFVILVLGLGPAIRNTILLIMG